MEAPGTISAEKLGKMTGIPIARLRQISAQGYFNKPEKGSYKLSEALVGLFRYYSESSKKLPVYDSIEACVGATGIPRSLLKAAKKKGCIAFRSNRVDLAILLDWIFTHGGAENETVDDLKRRKLEEECKLLTLERQEKERSVVSMIRVQEMIGQYVNPIRTTWLALPSAMAGRCNPTDPELAEKALNEWVKSSLRQVQAKFGESEPVSEAAAREEEE